MLSLLAALEAPFGATQELPTAVDAARDVSGESFASLEVSVAREVVYAHELVEVRFVVVLEKAFAEAQLVQLFRRELDLPVQIQASWLEGNQELAWEGGDATRTSGPRLALGTEVLHAAELPAPSAGERALELTRTFRVLRTGALELEPAQLRFTYATSFEEDPFRGRIPAERHDAYVLAEPLALDVRALPEEGRPPEFTGAVGSFEVTATAEPRDVTVGESVRWTLLVDGEGYLDGISAPRLDAVEGFAVQGWVEEPRARGRAFVYDLAPASHRTNKIAAFSFAYFDPDMAQYRTALTAPITILVRPRVSMAAPTEAPPPVSPGGGAAQASPSEQPPAPDADPQASDGATPIPLWIAGGVLLVAWFWMRGKRGSEPD